MKNTLLSTIQILTLLLSVALPTVHAAEEKISEQESQSYYLELMQKARTFKLEPNTGDKYLRGVWRLDQKAHVGAGHYTRADKGDDVTLTCNDTRLTQIDFNRHSDKFTEVTEQLAALRANADGSLSIGEGRRYIPLDDNHMAVAAYDYIVVLQRVSGRAKSSDEKAGKPAIACAQPQQKEDSKVWAQAEAKIQAHLKGIDPKMRYEEFKSERLTKYLPEYRAFRGLERNTIGELSLFIVNKDGEIADFDEDDLGAIADFLRARKIKVKSENDATEFVKFFGELQGDTGYHNKAWKFSGDKKKGGWKVKIKYIGDPSGSIIMPPDYEMDIDEQENFLDLRAKNGSGSFLEGE